MSLKLKPGELDKVRENYPDRIPIYITKCENKKDNLPDIRRHKFLVPSHFTFGEIIYMVRKWIKITPEQGIFLFVNKNTIPAPNTLLSQIYEVYKNKENILHIQYTTENTFG